MNKPQVDRCPHCDSSELFHQKVASGGGYGPHLLPGLGGIFDIPFFHAILCSDCGHVMLFAEKHRLERLSRKRSGWKKLNHSE